MFFLSISFLWWFYHSFLNIIPSFVGYSFIKNLSEKDNIRKKIILKVINLSNHSIETIIKHHLRK